MDWMDVTTYALHYGVESRRKEIRYLLNTSMNRILLSEYDWLTLETKLGRMQQKLVFSSNCPIWTTFPQTGRWKILYICYKTFKEAYCKEVSGN